MDFIQDSSVHLFVVDCYIVNMYIIIETPGVRVAARAVMSGISGGCCEQLGTICVAGIPIGVMERHQCVNGLV